MRRFVLDASVLLSAVLAKPDSNPSLLLDAVRAGEIEMMLCAQLIREVRAGLESRYFRDRITADERAAIPAMLADATVRETYPLSASNSRRARVYTGPWDCVGLRSSAAPNEPADDAAPDQAAD